MSATSSFDRSCANVAIPFDIGALYIDPCNCTLYYTCASIEHVVVRSCPPGALFDPTLFCQAPSDVSCKAEKPWEHCSDVANSESQEILEKRCAGSSSSSPSSIGGGGDGGGGGENGGAIAGAIVAVLIVVVIVVCIVLYVRKRGNPIRHLKETSCWRGMTRTGERTENGATSPAVHVTTSPPEHEEVYAHIDDLNLWRDSQLITTRATAPPRDLANNTHHQQNDYVVILASGNKTKKREPPEQHTPNLPGHSTETQDLTVHRTQTRDLVSQSTKIEDLAGHSIQTQDLAGHSSQAVTDQSPPLYSGLAEVDDGLYVHAYAVLGSQS